MKHGLIIGGTGMLEEASIHLSKSFDVITLLSRNPNQNNIIKKLNSKVNGISCDYSNQNHFINEMDKSIDRYGDIDTSICWIHSSGLHAFKGLVSNYKINNIYHVLGSIYYNDLEKAKKLYDEVKLLNSSVNYKQIILGSINNRWLTHTEISQGLIKTVENRNDTRIFSFIGNIPNF